MWSEAQGRTGRGDLLPHIHIASNVYNVYNGYGYRLLDLPSSNTGEALRFLKLRISHRYRKAEVTGCLPRSLFWRRIAVDIPSTAVIQPIDVSRKPISVLVFVLVSGARRNVRR
jgi:hypothetical protein